MSDSGVKLVNRYAELKNEQKQTNLEFKEELEKIEEALINFSEKEKIDVVFGSNNKVRIKENERYKFPSKGSTKRKELVEILKKHGKWEEVDQLDTVALNNIILEKKWNNKLLDVLNEYVEFETFKRLYVSKSDAK